MQFDYIETDRLILKIVDSKILKHIYATYSAEEVIPMLGFSNHEEYLVDKAKSDGGFDTYDRTILGFVMVIKENNKAIGRCGFHNWYQRHLRAEVGYAIFREEDRQHGYMSEAMEAILDYGFNTMKLNRVEAYIGCDNIPSLRIIKKNGFTEEGCLRQHYSVDGVPDDSLVFSLLKEEYTK
ncbi:MAG: GNAT family N-acetyltransferase [Crocinitomicaceae bacterium]|nr:GNAT family N-acetyltransferase [Crocinitomicaceae bacterium]